MSERDPAKPAETEEIPFLPYPVPVDAPPLPADREPVRPDDDDAQERVGAPALTPTTPSA